MKPLILPMSVCALACHVSAGARAGDPLTLNATLVSGESVTIVPPGGTFNVRIWVASPPTTYFNAALFRLIATVEEFEILDYGWHPPFVTDGATDFSLEGLTLPAVIVDTTLEGPGYPGETADVEFGNFDFFLASSGGPLVDVVMRAPLHAKPGSVFYVVAIPDLFTDGFDELIIDPGLLLTVEIANSAVLGDLSGDGIVSSIDLSILLGNWGLAGSVAGVGDLNGDGVVGQIDLVLLLGAWN
jgi:hypothetical protein